MEQRDNIKFCVKLGETLIETNEMLQTVATRPLRGGSIQGWPESFNNAPENVQGDPSVRSPTSEEVDMTT
jgi:hypothetical protein